MSKKLKLKSLFFEESIAYLTVFFSVRNNFIQKIVLSTITHSFTAVCSLLIENVNKSFLKDTLKAFNGFLKKAIKVHEVMFFDM